MANPSVPMTIAAFVSAAVYAFYRSGYGYLRSTKFDYSFLLCCRASGIVILTSDLTLTLNELAISA
jgi:hypothetical protein